MTTAANRSPVAALPGQDPDLRTRVSVTRASHSVAGCLVASVLGVGLLASANTATGHTQPVAVTRPVITDPPAPTYVLRLERDPFR
jgi:hypothetical protein